MAAHDNPGFSRANDMSPRPTLLDFVSEELLRAPLNFDQVVDAVLERWRLASPIAGRPGADAIRAVSQHRRDLVSGAVADLRGKVQGELVGLTGDETGAGAQTAPDLSNQVSEAPRLRWAPHPTELTLIGEDEVSVDIEVSRAVELVKSAAEFELRELQAYTSALVGDMKVARDTNPFRPERQVRALWNGLASLPLRHGLQAVFMRDAAEPLARVLRQGYAAACTRLEAQGGTPAAHRTNGQTVSTRSTVDLPDPGPEQLAALRAQMPLDNGGALSALAGQSPPQRRIDQQLIELLSRLFDAIQSDRRLPANTVSLLLRLQPSAIRVALREPLMLEDYGHAVWHFMDNLAFTLKYAPASGSERGLAHCRNLVDHLAGDGAADSALFDWASSRLTAYDRHVLEQSTAAAQEVIARIRSERHGVPQAIDIASMDTVPAALLDEMAALQGPPAQALALHWGDRVEAYLQGEWRRLQLLWSDPAADLWLLRDMATDQTWLLRQRALDRLVAEKLAVALRPRSLVRFAARRVLKSVQPAP